FFFGGLYADGRVLLGEPYTARFAVLERVVPPEGRVPRIVTRDALLAGRFFEQALTAGHEGLMAKALGTRYDAGARGAAWLKVKPAHTLDLVVLAAEWGHGRRRGRLSNLHLGARDPDTGGFVMLGKTFKGMTDELLAWQTTGCWRSNTRATSTPCTCVPSSWSRSPSTTCRQARSIRAVWRCASPGWCAIGPTSAPTRPIRSRPCCARATRALGDAVPARAPARAT